MEEIIKLLAENHCPDEIGNEDHSECTEENQPCIECWERILEKALA